MRAPTDVVLLHNQKAGDGDHSVEQLAAMLRRHGYRPECYTLKEALKRTDPLQRGEFIIVSGGDGSVRRVATRLAHQGRPIAPLPLGTANNIATSLGVCGEPDEIIAGWANGHRQRIDLGLATGPWGRRHFIEGIGLGLIGRAITTIETIDDVSDREFENRQDKLYRDLCVLLALANEMPPFPISVTQDGEDRSGRYLLLEVVNISRAGPGFELAQRANPGDRWLNVVSVRADERHKLQESLKRCLAALDHGTILESQRAHELRLELTAGELRIDDEVVWPETGTDAPDSITVDVTIDPGALEFVLPSRASL